MGRAVRDALRVTTSGACVLVQAAALYALAANWVEASNVSGDCGYDGTCADHGVLGAALTAALVVIAAELAIGTAWWAGPLWRQRRSPRGVDDWWALLTLHLPRTVMAGCLLSVLTVTGWRLLA
ncbi:hypothetical protein [Actinacidiphila yeochonensis]|uniref:hypothetical protein n=1 Tax=Actinacidiphila yeochonensis TaxID=89050 RepID=UPI00055B55E6|nr:hypothetical protein [Actinacidiphila yeochonensis]